MRPSECERFWNPKNKLGWNQINIEGEDPYIYLPLGLIRKEGLPTRKIPIRAGFLKMLKEFKREVRKISLSDVKNWKRVYASARKIWGKRLTISSKKDEAKDIARHTFISNLHLYAGKSPKQLRKAGPKSLPTQPLHQPSLSEKDTKYFFESIDTSALTEQINIQSKKESSPLGKIIKMYGQGVLDDPKFLKAWMGGKMMKEVGQVSTTERIKMLQNLWSNEKS